MAKNEGVRIRTEHDEEDVLKCVSKNEEVIITYDNCCCFSAPFTATFFYFFSPAWRRRKVMVMGPKKKHDLSQFYGPIKVELFFNLVRQSVKIKDN